MNATFIFLSILLLSPQAMAASWHKLKSGGQMSLEVGEPRIEATDNKADDKDKKKDKDRKIKIWSKISYKQPQQAIPGDFYYSSSKTLSEINCTARSLKSLQKIYYGDDARESKIIHYGDNEKLVTIIPDSPEEAVFDFACNFNQPKTTTQAPTPQKDPAEPAAKAVKPEPPKEKPQKATSNAKAPAAKTPPPTPPAEKSPASKATSR